MQSENTCRCERAERKCVWAGWADIHAHAHTHTHSHTQTHTHTRTHTHHVDTPFPLPLSVSHVASLPCLLPRTFPVGDVAHLCYALCVLVYCVLRDVHGRASRTPHSGELAPCTRVWWHTVLVSCEHPLHMSSVCLEYLVASKLYLSVHLSHKYFPPYPSLHHTFHSTPV